MVCDLWVSVGELKLTFDSIKQGSLGDEKKKENPLSLLLENK